VIKDSKSPITASGVAMMIGSLQEEIPASVLAVLEEKIKPGIDGPGVSPLDKFSLASIQWKLGKKDDATKTAEMAASGLKEAMGDKDFGGYVKDAESGHQGLRWDEIDGVLIKAVQELHGQVKEERQARLALEQRLAVLEMALGPSGASRAKA
jgi:hypothetical protein